MRKYLSLFILGLMLLPMLFSCVRPGNSDSSDTSKTAQTTNAVTTSPYELKDNLPDDLNFNGQTITFLGWKDSFNEFGSGELNGDTINDAIYYRDKAVEERLGVKFVSINTLNNNAPQVLATIQPSIMANDHAYDILRTHSQTPGYLALNNLLINLRELDYIDLSMPWWLSEFTESATIEGKIYLITGDICPSIWRMMDMNLCNYDMLQKYQLEDPQALAIEGKWTLDKQLEMVTGIYEDLNKNNQKDAEDQFGIMSTLAITDAYFYCTGAKMLEKDANGKLTLSKDWAGQKVIDIIERMGNYYSTDDGFITNEFNEYSKIASEGRALFLNCEVYFSESFLADASYNFKVLPVPKYSESQENYPIVLSNPFTVYSIPLDAADPDMSAAVLEAMASESYRKVTPIMYEKLIKLRYVGSETDSAMIDIIRKGITFDTARLFYFNFTDLYAFRRHIQGNLRTWTSTVTGLTESYKKVVEEISTKYASLE